MPMLFAEKLIEVWRDVGGYEGIYQVSSRGRVKSMARTRIGRAGKPVRVFEKIMKQSPKNPKIHPRVELYKCDTYKTFCVHRLVLQAFVGPCPLGKQCCHNDGNPRNNLLENLRWDTPASNQADRVKHGTDMRGEKHPNTKLNVKAVREVKLMYRAGIRNYEICRFTGISKTSVENIVLGRCWKWVE